MRHARPRSSGGNQTQRRFGRGRLLLALAAVALIAASCGSTDPPSDAVGDPAVTAPSVTAPARPPTTGEQPATTDTTAAPIPVDRALTDVYLIRDETMVPVARQVEWEGLVANTLEALLAGPTAGEAGLGLGTALHPAIELHGLTVTDDLATVDLSANFGAANGTSHMVARLAQVVFTVTQFPEIDEVSFALDGRPVTELPGEGIDLSRPLDRSDYAHLFSGDPVPRPDPVPDPPPVIPTWSNDDLAGLDGGEGSWLASVALVRADDVLNVRTEPGASRPIVGRLTPDARVIATGETATVGSSTWVRIVTPVGAHWVNGYYLAPDADGFADDSRVETVLLGLSRIMTDRGDLSAVSSRRGLYVSYNGELERYSRAELGGLLQDPATRVWPVPDGVNPGPPQTFAEAVGDAFVATYATPDTTVVPNEWDPRERSQPIPHRLRAFNHVGIHRPADGSDWSAWYVSVDYENGEPRVVGLTIQSWTP